MTTKWTMPQAIIISSFIISLAVFLDDVLIISNANAEVAGMNAYELRYDYDFKKAVKDVVERNCEIQGGYVNIENGYGNLYGMELSC